MCFVTVNDLKPNKKKILLNLKMKKKRISLLPQKKSKKEKNEAFHVFNNI